MNTKIADGLIKSTIIEIEKSKEIIKVIQAIAKELKEANDRAEAVKFQCEQCGELFTNDELAIHDNLVDGELCKPCYEEMMESRYM